MSRLYCWIDSDMSQEVTRRANENLRIQVNYGSRDDSKHLVTLEVSYPNNHKTGESKPSVIATKQNGAEGAS